MNNSNGTNNATPRAANNGNQQNIPFIDLTLIPDNVDPPPTARRRRLSEELAVLDAMASAGPTPAKRAKEVPRPPTPDDVYHCPVCLERVRLREPRTTRCGHVFCKSCIEATVRCTEKCPLCQRKITQRQLLPIYL